jgi:hypothetical protein
LAELNTRSRAYTARLWQVPFAYIGILGLVLAQWADKNPGPGFKAIILFYGGLIGLAVLIHMTALMEAIKRAVDNIKKVENSLGLEQTARYRPVWHGGPLFGMVVLALVSCFIAAGYYWHSALFP